MRLLRRTRTPSNDPRQVRRILIADDDPAIANLVRMALDDPRYEVLAVGTGLEAIQQFRKAGLRPGDPGRDDAVCRRLRGLPAHP